jgi:hypothetical protein
MPTPFGSELILEEKISEATLRAYCVGFDQNQFRLSALADVIASVIPEFALGPHVSGNPGMNEIVDRLREAARRIYLTEKYKRRGEFGELILHLLLRDRFGSVPLLSKIYFKDAHNAAVHGFDGVHVVVKDKKKELWLGESKMYASGKAGIDDLIVDLEKHLKRDYLRAEFELILSKLPAADRDIDYWRRELHKHNKLENILDSVCVPMVCTYTGDCYAGHRDNTAAFLKTFENECEELRLRFEKKQTKIKTDVDIILLLVPVKSKPDLVKELHARLKAMRRI